MRVCNRGIIGTMVTLVIGSRLWVFDAPKEFNELLEQECTHRNPEWGKQARYGGPVAKDIPKTIETFQVEKDKSVKRPWSISVPRGLLDRVVELLRDHHLEFKLVDYQAQGRSFDIGLSFKSNRDPYSFQTDIVRCGLEHKTALVRSPTGSGKTFAELLFAMATGRWSLILVPSIALAKQWQDAALENGVHEDYIGQIFDGERDIRPLTVGLPISIANWLKQLPPGLPFPFGTLIVDEVQTAAAETFANVVNQCPSKYRLGMSADERRADGKEFLIHDAFGPVRFEISRDELIEQRVIRDVEVRMVETAFEDPSFLAVREKARAMRQHVKDGKGVSPFAAKRMKFDEQAAYVSLINKMSDNHERNEIIRRIGNASLPQLIAPDPQCIVFTHRREHVLQLASAWRARLALKNGKAPEVGVLLGSQANRAEFQRACDGVNEGTVRLVVGTYKATGVGINLPSLSRAIVATPIHTNRPFYNQVRGRVSRKGDNDPVLWYLWDRKVFGDEPLEAMLRWNKRVLIEDPSTPGGWIDARPQRGILWGTTS